MPFRLADPIPAMPPAAIASNSGRDSIMRSHLRSSIWFCRFGLEALLMVFAATAPAGVVVVQNVSPGATSWPGSPLIQTMSNPAGQAAIAESFNAVGGCTNYCQTFTITTTNYTLQSVCIYAGGGTGTGASTNMTLRLFDLGNQTAPNPSPYAPAGDLFNSGNGLAITYTPQTAGVLQFNFTGGDQVTLTNGRMYAFEISGVINSSPLLWQRTTSNTYAGGAAYRDRSWINGNNAREFALAVYTTVAAGTNFNPDPFPAPNGIVYHAFSTPAGGDHQDGANPAAGLALSGGVLCGTTLNGGASAAGTAYYLTPDGSNFVTSRSFASAADASHPQGELVVSGNGFFGTSFAGGSGGGGTVYLGQTNGNVALLRSFATVHADTATNSGGASPSALLALSGGTLYGTTTAGGAAANGTIFSLATNGAAFSALHNFSLLDSQTGTNTDGATPWGGLILSGDKLYGTASAGGAAGNGGVYSISTNGANFTVLYNFPALNPVTATNADGATPYGGLVLSSGTLFGTTFAGGLGGRGTIFSLQTNGSGFTVLHHFTATDPITHTNTDGASPAAGLILSSNVLYGTASGGGAGAAGTVFLINLASTQFTTLHSFAALASSGTNTDGAFSVAPVLRLGNSIYGTTFAGGPGAAGTVFSIPLPVSPAILSSVVQNPDGTVTVCFSGAPNSTNVIQSATSLTLPIVWENISTNVSDATGAWQFTDSPNGAKRFYRSYAR